MHVDLLIYLLAIGMHSSYIYLRFLLADFLFFYFHSEGRSYLLQHTDLIQMLVGVLRFEQNDSFARQNALGALQKFSLRRQAQTTMIEEDLIQWIATILREHTDSK